MGYVHDTNMAQYIPPNTMHCVTGTWTDIAGQVAGTIARHKAAAAETATINVPIQVPSNYIALKGCMLKYVEIDYEIRTDVLTSSTLSLVKVVRGANGAVAVVSAPAGTQLLTPATTAGTVAQHRDRFTLTTPAYISSEEYYFLKMIAIATATCLLDLYAAVAYFTERL